MWKYHITRWYSSNGPAARLLRWSVFVLCLVTYGHTCHGHTCQPWSHLSPRPMVTLFTCVTCIHVQMSKYLHNTILLIFPKEVTIPGNSLCLRSYFSREDSFPGKSYFSGSHTSQEVTFPGSHISGKSHFTGIHIS